ncbi:MAG: hypothetical protein KC425_00245, partial [Anaerolineales bacterium]|nr:hypothetical protein [Anaerolineales bacterium]
MATQTPPAFNKIGLHTGPGTNPELLYSYLQDLTEAGIPAFITAVSDHTLIQTALSLTRSAELNHTFVFSLPAAQTGGDLFPFDQPDFYLNNKGQEQSVAAKIWRQALGSLPTDFDRERVWLELLAGTPEVLPDRQADWLGEFGVALARMAQQDGFRLALFGWQSGHPHPQSWRTDGMLRLLHRCAESPDQLAISLQEFSGSPETLSPDAPGSGIGRFRAILDAAADQKINPPTLLITAWGWDQARVPDPETAFAHMLDANEQLYAHYPAVRGAALWTLAHELSPVAAQAEALVAPIRELSLDYEFRPDPADAPPYAASFPAQSQTDPYAAGSTAQTPAYLPTETDPYDTTGPDDALDLPSEIDSNEQPVAPSQPAALASTINSFFSEAELRSLSFDLALDYDELPGQDKQSKAQALVSTLASRSRMHALLRLLRHDRPRIPWSEIASGAAPAQSLDLGD